MAVRIVGVLVFTNSFIAIYASYHWKVTENGRISSQVEKSGFPLKRQDDLIVLLEQEERLRRATQLHRELITLRVSVNKQWNRIEGKKDIEKMLYAADLDCLQGENPLGRQNLNIEFLDYSQGSRIKMKKNHKTVEPDCTVYSELDFSMRTFPHLETLNRRKNFSLSVIPMSLTFDSKNYFNFNIDAMLRHNSSDWTAYNLASLYWRTIGNGTNALECARRALYFSPWSKRYIVLLNLGTLLQDLESLGEAAIVLHSAVDHDPECPISHLALGNVYVALGDYNRSLACYDNVLSLAPNNKRALQLKHALLCHKQLEAGLLELQTSVDRILSDLRKHNALQDEWISVQKEVDRERNTKLKEYYTFPEPIYLNLQILVKDVKQQAKAFHRKGSKQYRPVNDHHIGQQMPETFEYLDEEFEGDYEEYEEYKEYMEYMEYMEDEEEEEEEEEEEDEEIITDKKLVDLDEIRRKISVLIASIKAKNLKKFNLDFSRKMKEKAGVRHQRKRVEIVKNADSCVKESEKLN